MTDEEMAVNWIHSQGWNEETLPSDEFGQMFPAFLAGLKVCRPKWHKVADGDLPKDEDWKWCISYRGYFYIRCRMVSLLKFPIIIGMVTHLSTFQLSSFCRSM